MDKKSNKFVLWFKALPSNKSFVSIISSLIAIAIGFIFGLILLLILKPGEALYGFTKILITGVANVDKMGKVLYTAMPLILTGLGVGFAFKTGLFNIGASGQYLVGAFFALFVSLVFKFPWWAGLLVSIITGAIWGSIPGIFKAFLNVNEVITSIMFNWIGLFIVNVVTANTKAMLHSTYGGSSADRTANLLVANPSAIIPSLGLEKIYSSLGIGIIIAIFVAIIVYIILNKTVFGYELKACGFNKNASKAAGINEKKNIILSMAIAGGLAGLGGGLYYLNGGAQYTIIKSLPNMGFNGIPVALLGSSNPIGIIFAAIFIAYIQVGGDAMQPEFAPEVVSIIISVIIYVSAFSLLFKEIISRIKNNKTPKVKEEVIQPIIEPETQVKGDK